MIVKKIPNPNKSATKAVRIRALAGYIRAPETENETEKCLYAGARGFLCDTAEAQTEEMLALARDAPRSRDPITHYVLSWHDDEHPTPAQVEEIIDLLLHELDVAEHQTIYALHVDTDNTHLHVMLNRVHPDTLKAVEINGGFDIKALHRACARIEQAQGWRAERNACYRVNAAGDIEASARAAPERMPRPPQRLVDEEHRRGEKSAARIAIEEAGPLIEAAESWEALHRRLGERDLRYARSGSGAAVQVGEVFVKASTVSRKATLKGLEARLGPYEGPPATVVSLAPAHEQDGDRGEARHTPDPMRARALIEAARSWEGLHEALAAQGFRYVKRGSGAHVVAGRGEAAVSMKASAVSRRAALRQLEARLGPFEAPGAEGFHEEEEPSQRQAEREERHDAWAQWEAECEAEALALAAHQREERDALRRERSWKGRFLELSLHRSLLAAAHAREKAALEEAFRHGREALEERFLPGKDPAPWRGDPGIAFLWRSRHLEPRALEPASQATQFTDARPPQDIRDYHGRAVGPWVLYATRAQHERGEVAFVDRGKRVTLHERDSDAAALAAMQLAQQKWGRFRARGSEAHKRRSAWLAAKHGLALANPELQGLIAQYRRALGRDQPPPRLRQRERAALLRPPQGPLAEPALRAPPELVQRAPAGLIRPPQGPLLDPALEAPPPLAERGPMTRVRPPSLPRVEVELEAPARVAPRSTPTLTRPPAAPHVGVTLEAPTRLTPRTPAAPMRPPSLPRVEVELEVPPPLAERGPMTRVRPPSLPRVEVKLEVPPRLGQREPVALRSPPAGPSVEAELGAPPELAPRSPAALMHPQQGPLAVPALDAPARVAPRSTPTLTRPPAAPHVGVTLEAPTRLTPRTPAAPMRPPSLPRVEVELEVPPPLAERGPMTRVRPPSLPRVEVKLEVPPRLGQREPVALRSPPAGPSVEAELGAPPELAPRSPAALMHPPQGPLAVPALDAPAWVAPRSTPTLARPPAAPRVEVSLEAPTRLTPRTPAAPIRPPSLPRVEVAPGVPPPLRQRGSVAPRSPPTAPSVEAELGAPPELAPRSTPTLARPPAAPRVEVSLEAPTRLTPRTPAVPIRPPSLPRVEVAPGVPPPLRQCESVAPRSPPTAPSVEAELGAPPELAPRSTPTLARPPAAPRVEVSLEAPTRLTPRTPAVPIRPPSLPRVEVAPGVPPPLRQCESVAPRSPPTAPSVEAELGAPPELAPRSAPTLARPPQSPKLEYQLVAAYDMDAAREAIELARRHEDLEGQYGELTTLIKPGVVILLDQADEPRYTGAHTLSTAARAWACRLDASFDQLPEVKDALERAVWPDLFQTLNIDARIIEHEALPHLATALRRTVHDRVTQYLSTECRGEGDRRSPVDRLQSELYEALKPRPREGWHPHNDILSSQRSQDRLDEYNASPVRDSQSATLVAKAVAPVLTEIARRHYGQSGKPPEQPSEVPSVEEFSGWRQATRETRRQAALTEYEQKTKARNEVVSEARADWAARAPGLFERLAEEVLYIENQYWHARKAEDEEKKEASLRQRRRKYDQVGDQRSDQGQFSGRGYA